MWIRGGSRPPAPGPIITSLHTLSSMFNYFIHPSNLQKMDAVLKMRMSEGSSGYGIFMMLLELLRDSDGYQTAYDPNVLAWALHESDIPKLQNVCEKYGLFQITEDKQICCPWLTSVMAQHEEKKKKLSEAGKRSAASRAAKAEQPQAPLQPSSNEVATTLITPPQGGSNVVASNEQQTKTNKRNQNKKTTQPFTIVGVSGEDIFSDDFIKKVGRLNVPSFDEVTHGHEFFSDQNHNTAPLMAAAVTFQLSLPQVQVLHAATQFCKIGSAPFMAFIAACRHCQTTNFKPKFGFEYLMSRVKDAQDL